MVVIKSLCGFVSNQVQYDMECAQYQGLSYYIIINKYILDIYIYFMEFRLRPQGFMEIFAKQQSSGS